MRETTHDGENLTPILDAQMSKMSPEQRVAMASLNEEAKKREVEKLKWDNHKAKENKMEEIEIVSQDTLPATPAPAPVIERELEEKCLPDPLEPQQPVTIETVPASEVPADTPQADCGIVQVTNSLRYTQETLAEEFKRIFFEEIMALRNAGQKEYAHDAESPFANFERGAKDMEIDRKKVLWVYAMKHKDGIAAAIKGHTSQREDVRGRINDLIVYLLLLRGVYNEEAGNTGNFGLGALSEDG